MILLWLQGGGNTPLPKSDVSLRSAMLANEKQEVPDHEKKFSTIMKRNSKLQCKPTSPELSDGSGAAELEREMAAIRQRLMGK